MTVIDNRQNRVSFSCNCTLGNEEICLVDLLSVLRRYKIFILCFCLAAFVLSFGITLLMPDVYTATARALPLKVRDRFFYAKSLQGSAVSNHIIERFGLEEVYREDSKSAIHHELQKRVNISAGKGDYLIYIKVNDEDPKRAVSMANAYVEELKNLSIKKEYGDPALLLQFLERRLDTVKKNLSQADRALTLFQEKHKVFSVDGPTKCLIEVFAKLKGDLANKEIELGVPLPDKKGPVPEETVLWEWFARVQNQVRALEQSMINGLNSDKHAIAAAAVPEIGQQYARLLLDFRIQAALFELLSLQREVAKVWEVKKDSSIQVLDDAFVPDKKSGPKRSLIVLLATITVGFFAVLIAFARDYMERMGERFEGPIRNQ